MYVCMYVYMYVCKYVCMYACMHVCMYVCTYVCIGGEHIYIYIYIYIYMLLRFFNPYARPKVPKPQDPEPPALYKMPIEDLQGV